MAATSGCYLLAVVAEPVTEDDKQTILRRFSKGLLSWDATSTGCDLNALQEACNNVMGKDVPESGMLIQYSTEGLGVEVLVNPPVSTLKQCVKNLLTSTISHKHIVHSGYAFTGSGSWMLQNGAYTFEDFLSSFQDPLVHREKGCTIHVHCDEEGDWTSENFAKDAFAKVAKVYLNPPDKMDHLPGSEFLVKCLETVLNVQNLTEIMEASSLVGNIRFNRPTLYLFPAGQGDCALFGINGFNMLVDGGFNRKPCAWEFIRHLDRLDAVLVTRLSESNLCSMSTLMKRKTLNNTYPQIGYVFCNIAEGKNPPSPSEETGKDKDSMLVSVVGEGHGFIQTLNDLKLVPHQCWSDNTSEPFVLYHKVGHGTLEMYVLSPPKDSKEMRDFLEEWSSYKEKFSCVKSDLKGRGKECMLPLSHVTSICAVVVWRPNDPKDTITRILFPGSAPQSKIFEGLEKLKSLDILRHPRVTKASLSAVVLSKPKTKTIKSSAPNSNMHITKATPPNRKNTASPALSVSSVASRNGDINGPKKDTKITKEVKTVKKETKALKEVKKTLDAKKEVKKEAKEPKKDAPEKKTVTKAAPKKVEVTVKSPPELKKAPPIKKTTAAPKKEVTAKSSAPLKSELKKSPPKSVDSKATKDVANKKTAETKTVAKPKPKPTAATTKSPVKTAKPTPVPKSPSKLTRAIAASAAVATAAVTVGVAQLIESKQAEAEEVLKVEIVESAEKVGETIAAADAAPVIDETPLQNGDIDEAIDVEEPQNEIPVSPVRQDMLSPALSEPVSLTASDTLSSAPMETVSPTPPPQEALLTPSEEKEVEKDVITPASEVNALDAAETPVSEDVDKGIADEGIVEDSEDVVKVVNGVGLEQENEAELNGAIPNDMMTTSFVGESFDAMKEDEHKVIDEQYVESNVAEDAQQLGDAEREESGRMDQEVAFDSMEADEGHVTPDIDATNKIDDIHDQLAGATMEGSFCVGMSEGVENHEDVVVAETANDYGIDLAGDKALHAAAVDHDHEDGNLYGKDQIVDEPLYEKEIHSGEMASCTPTKIPQSSDDEEDNVVVDRTADVERYDEDIKCEPKISVDAEDVELTETNVDEEDVKLPETNVDEEDVKPPETNVDEEDVKLTEENVDEEDVKLTEANVDEDDFISPDQQDDKQTHPFEATEGFYEKIEDDMLPDTIVKSKFEPMQPMYDDEPEDEHQRSRSPSDAEGAEKPSQSPDIRNPEVTEVQSEINITITDDDDDNNVDDDGAVEADRPSTAEIDDEDAVDFKKQEEQAFQLLVEEEDTCVKHISHEQETLIQKEESLYPSDQQLIDSEHDEIKDDSDKESAEASDSDNETRDGHFTKMDDDIINREKTEEIGTFDHHSIEKEISQSITDGVHEKRDILDEKDHDSAEGEEVEGDDEMVLHPTLPGESQDLYSKVGLREEDDEMRDPIGPHFIPPSSFRGGKDQEEPLYEEEDSASERSASPVLVEQPVFGETDKADFPELVTLSGGTTPSEPQSPKSPLDSKKVNIAALDVMEALSEHDGSEGSNQSPILRDGPQGFEIDSQETTRQSPLAQQLQQHQQLESDEDVHQGREDPYAQSYGDHDVEYEAEGHCEIRSDHGMEQSFTEERDTISVKAEIHQVQDIDDELIMGYNKSHTVGEKELEHMSESREEIKTSSTPESDLPHHDEMSSSHGVAESEMHYAPESELDFANQTGSSAMEQDYRLSDDHSLNEPTHDLVSKPESDQHIDLPAEYQENEKEDNFYSKLEQSSGADIGTKSDFKLGFDEAKPINRNGNEPEDPAESYGSSRVDFDGAEGTEVPSQFVSGSPAHDPRQESYESDVHQHSKDSEITETVQVSVHSAYSCGGEELLQHEQATNISVDSKFHGGDEHRTMPDETGLPQATDPHDDMYACPSEFGSAVEADHGSLRLSKPSDLQDCGGNAICPEADQMDLSGLTSSQYNQYYPNGFGDDASGIAVSSSNAEGISDMLTNQGCASENAISNGGDYHNTEWKSTYSSDLPESSFNNHVHSSYSEEVDTAVKVTDEQDSFSRDLHYHSESPEDKSMKNDSPPDIPSPTCPEAIADPLSPKRSNFVDLPPPYESSMNNKFVPLADDEQDNLNFGSNRKAKFSRGSDDPYGQSSDDDDSSSLPGNVSPYAYTNKAYNQGTEDADGNHIYKPTFGMEHTEGQSTFDGNNPQSCPEGPTSHHISPGMTYSPGFPDMHAADPNYDFRLEEWGKPMGLPTPPDSLKTTKKPAKAPTTKSKVSVDKRPSLDNGKSSVVASKLTGSPAKKPKDHSSEGGKPVYVDLAYVPHHGDLNYSDADFFKRIRARYYVFSGIGPSREVLNALLEAKKSWKENLEVTIIPTYETDALGYWMAQNQDMLTEYSIDVAPSASRCTVNLQDHETSCAAYRLEF